MRVIALDIPEEPEAIAAWLEQQMLTGDLLDLVTELEVIHGPPAERYRIEDVLGDQADNVLERGLATLSNESLRQLLTQPRLLFELQEYLLLEKATYWRDRLADADTQRAVAATKQHLLRKISGKKVEPPPASSQSSAVWKAVLALAACLFIALGIGYWANRPPTPQPPVAWGWLNDDAIPDDTSASEYLLKLADGGQQFFNKDPDDPAAFRQRVKEFRDGCQRLKNSTHSPLSKDDAQLLVGRCQRWLNELDEHLKVMANDSFDLEAAKRDVGRDIREMIDTLQRHAQQLA